MTILIEFKFQISGESFDIQKWLDQIENIDAIFMAKKKFLITIESSFLLCTVVWRTSHQLICSYLQQNDW